MSGTKRLSVDLPVDLARMVEDKVASGAFTSESEVVTEGLRTLQDHDAAVERWLREEVVPAYDAYKRDPSRAIPIETVFSGLEARYRERKAKQSRGE